MPHPYSSCFSLFETWKTREAEDVGEMSNAMRHAGNLASEAEKTQDNVIVTTIDRNAKEARSAKDLVPGLTKPSQIENGMMACTQKITQENNAAWSKNISRQTNSRFDMMLQGRSENRFHDY